MVRSAGTAIHDLGQLTVFAHGPRDAWQSSASNRGEDAGYDIVGRLVFPRSNDGPTGVAEQLIRLGVALSIPSHLLGPEVGIRLRDRVVGGTPVPEAPVHEHSDLRACEHQVSPAIELLDRPVIDAETQSGCMRSAPHGHFRRGVSSTVRLHAAPDPRRGRP
jgi:hypothetical protein